MTENHYQGRDLIRKTANYTGPSLNFFEGSLDGITGTDVFTITLGEAAEGVAFLKVSGIFLLHDLSYCCLLFCQNVI